MKEVSKKFVNNLRYLCLVSVIALGLIAIVGTGGGGGGGGIGGSDENNITEEQQGYESQPVVTGKTTYEIQEGITSAYEAFVIQLSDGTKLDIPATGGELNISLERKSNTIDLETVGMQTTGSMRVFSFTTPSTSDNPDNFFPSITIPAKEAGNIDPDTINMLRIGDYFVNGELVTDHYAFLPVHRDNDGNFVAIDPTMLSFAYSDVNAELLAARLSTSRADTLVQGLPNKVTYTLSTFQENLNWGKNPLLVRMIPDGSVSERRRPAIDQDGSELEKSVINVILLVHGHNETEYDGFKESLIPEPWGVPYKRDVWTYLYDTFLIEHDQKRDCTFFYEYIYPTYRPAITHTGTKETLGDSLSRLINNDPLLKKLLNKGTSFNLFIVSHSMGGLVARAGLRFMDSKLLSNFRKLVTWGTPHHGSPIVTLRYVVGAHPGYSIGKGLVYFDTSLLTANQFYQLTLNKEGSLDTPGTRDLRWDGGTSSDPFTFRLTLSDFLQESLEQQLKMEEYNLEDGTWLYNHNLRAFNENDPFQMSDKYAFLYGVTTKRVKIELYNNTFYELKYLKKLGPEEGQGPEETAIGATIIDKLIRDAGTNEPTYGDLLRGDSDGAVPLFSASGKGIVGPYPPGAVYIGDIDHEEYFGSPRDGQFRNIVSAQSTAQETFKALGFSTSEYNCKDETDEGESLIAVAELYGGYIGTNFTADSDKINVSLEEIFRKEEDGSQTLVMENIPTISAESRGDTLTIQLSPYLSGPGSYYKVGYREDFLHGGHAIIAFTTKHIQHEVPPVEPVVFIAILGEVVVEEYGIKVGDRIKGTFNVTIYGSQEKCDDPPACNATWINPIEGSLKGSFNGILK